MALFRAQLLSFVIKHPKRKKALYMTLLEEENRDRVGHERPINI
jgi:hypothetical protein